MMKDKSCTRLASKLLVIVGLISAMAGPAGAADTWWQHDPASPGDWFDPANWTGGVPTSADSAYVDNGGTARIASGAADASDLRVGRYPGTSGAVEHSGGSNTIQNALTLGDWHDASGSYVLSGTGQLQAKYERLHA